MAMQRTTLALIVLAAVGLASAAHGGDKAGPKIENPPSGPLDNYSLKLDIDKPKVGDPAGPPDLRIPSDNRTPFIGLSISHPLPDNFSK